MSSSGTWSMEKRNTWLSWWYQSLISSTTHQTHQRQANYNKFLHTQQFSRTFKIETTEGISSWVVKQSKNKHFTTKTNYDTGINNDSGQKTGHSGQQDSARNKKKLIFVYSEHLAERGVEYNLNRYIGFFCFDWEENKIKICQYIGLSITYQKIVSYPQMVWNVHVCATTIHSDYEI